MEMGVVLRDVFSSLLIVHLHLHFCRGGTLLFLLCKACLVRAARAFWAVQQTENKKESYLIDATGAAYDISDLVT
jgi:hypothetical protein